MNVVYERSGGFIGMNQRLEVDAGKLRAFDRGQKRTERQLTDAEAKALADLVARVEDAAPPKTDPALAGTSDTFTLKVKAGNASANVQTLNVPYGKGDGSAWGELLAWLDAKLGAALEGKAHPPDLVDPELLK